MARFLLLGKLVIYCERQTHKQIIMSPHNKGCSKGAQIGCADNNSMINSLEKLVLSSEALGPKI